LVENMRRETLDAVLVLPLVVLATFPGCSGQKAPGFGDTADSGPRADATAPVEASSPPPGDDAASPIDAGNPGMDATAPMSCNGPAPARGAALPYQEYEAENSTGASTNGTAIGPSRAVNDPNVFNSIAGESSGRQAVKLSATGQYVQFTTACAANSIVVRYVIPDSTDGNGISATLGLYVGDTRVQSLPLTSHYAWAYGDPTATDTTTNDPSDGFARHFYDEVRVQLPSDVPAGTIVKLQQDASDTAPYYVIDLVDMEEVAAPIGQPANSLSVTTCGATPNDGTDDGVAILNCLNMASAQGKIAWIPEGTFNDDATPLSVNVTVQGAGMWHTTVVGASAFFVCSGPCSVSELSLYGDVTLRDDAHSVHAIGGSFGSGSRIDNVWMEHFTTGPWIGQVNSPQTTGMTIHGCRMRDLYADGVNLNTGTSNSTVEQSHARSTGDDSFASWSSGPANSGNVFQFNTAQLPWRASCFSIYGGTSNAVQDSVCADTVTYPGILIDQDFASTSFGGMTNVLRDDVIRSGGGMFGTKWGAVTVSGPQAMAGPITGVTIGEVNIESATYGGVYLVGPTDPIQDLFLDNIMISQPGTYGIQVDPSASGTATATNVVVTTPGTAGLNNAADSTFTIVRGGGDTGW
jgi:hypothetical protein